MIKYLQLPFYFDAKRMQEDLRSLNSENPQSPVGPLGSVSPQGSVSWQLHYQKLHYEGEWSAIPLRSVDGASDNIFIAPQENTIYNDTAFLKACPYLQTVLHTFQCPLQAVRLLKLNAGAIIKEHRDAELNFEKGEIRLHIPVITHADVEFYLDKERMYLKEGECWYMNFSLPHSLVNNSSVNRIHLVIDAVVNDWVKTIFDSPAIICKKEIEDVDGQYDANTKKEMVYRLREMNTETSNRLADQIEDELSNRGG